MLRESGQVQGPLASNVQANDFQPNDVQQFHKIPIDAQASDVQENIDVNNVDAEEHYYSTHSSYDGDGVPTIDDIAKYQEFKDFMGENNNIYDKEENMAILDSRQVDNCVDPIVIGMEWPTINEARSYIRIWSIQIKFTYYQKNNKSYRLRFKCDSEDKNKLANILWVANYYEDRLKNIKLSRPIDVFTTIRRKFGINLSYWTAWNAWTICMEKIVGSYDKGYFKMSSLVRELLIVNPGSIIGWLRGYMPVPGLDGYFLKGKYGGVCLSVIARAFKIVDKDDFLAKLGEDHLFAKQWLERKPPET
ncbi:hypothetical protein GIB67_024301 [Kingdonia uniflora]|uniref:Uncharacterized protein n=1 Tax=Kingdonia uniflora TaxID=39325 RepID=A0A7J7LF08_9MAGN|nr:hypothetical protein GIB67_024301 [Kingdonia uniflora]